MEVKIKFRFNKITGEVEVFDVEDTGTMQLSEAEHNKEHDRIASSLGQVVERNPQVIELPSGSATVLTDPTQVVEDEPEQTTSSKSNPQQQRAAHE